MITIEFVVPGSLDTRTGGYRYDKRVTDDLASTGHTVNIHTLSSNYPFPGTAEHDEAERVLSSIQDGSVTVIDGLAFGVLPAVLARHAERLQLIALVHHPLALETGLNEAQALSLRNSERAALVHARRVITTSPSTTKSLADYGVAAHRITTIEPGTDSAPQARGSESERLNLLCVATLTARKGHGVLIKALSKVQQAAPEIAWHLHCVGSTERDAPALTQVQDLVVNTGLSEYISLHGEADDAALAEHYARADVFVLASYHEGYGMVLTEALARGLPIISTTAGAIPDTVPANCGILVEAGDADALADALASVLGDSRLRSQLRDSALGARTQLRSWTDAAEEFAEACTLDTPSARVSTEAGSYHG